MWPQGKDRDVTKALIEALADAIATVKYLAPESFDDAAHEKSFKASIGGWERTLSDARRDITVKPGKPNDCREIIAELVEWAAHTGGWEAPIWNRAKAYLRAHPLIAPGKPGFYLIHVWGDVEPRICGPYKTEATRNATAKRLKKRDNDSMFWLDITTHGVESGSYPDGFFDKE